MAASPAPDPSAILAATTPRLRRDALAAAVRDGSLDGRLVFVDGGLTSTPVDCGTAAPGHDGCVDLAIPGLGLRVEQGGTTIPWRGDPPPGAWLVAVSRADGLTYLGSLVPRPAGVRVPASESAQDSLPEVAGTLFELEGHLVQHPIHLCARMDPAATPCPQPEPFLARDRPRADGTRISDAGWAVSVVPGATGIDPAEVVVSGTFLVQRDPASPGEVQVVARYVPSLAVRVQVP